MCTVGVRVIFWDTLGLRSLCAITFCSCIGLMKGTRAHSTVQEANGGGPEATTVSVPPVGRRKRKTKSVWTHSSDAKRHRSKPHPKDHQFKVSADAMLHRGLPATVNRLRMHGQPCTAIVFALAMGWDNARDRLRLQMLQVLTPGTKVITVSRIPYTKGSLPHLTCNFASRRGQQDLIKRIASEKTTHPHARVVVVLDHYWCEIRYYERLYGLKWLSTDAHKLLLGGADEVVLPYDNGENIPYSASGMAHMLAGPIHVGLDCTFIDGPSNPLWMASQCEAITAELASLPGGDNAENCRQYLHPRHPFVRCIKKHTIDGAETGEGDSATD
jgi:hypothetical protein